MRKLLLTTAAISALMVASPLVAQNMPDQNPANPANPQTDQAPPDQMKPATPATQSPSAAENAAPADNATPADQQNQAPQFAQQQKDNELLASNIIGADVQDSQQQSVGTVNDIVLAKEGSIDSIVVGVGGFLGIGQKNVAINYQAFQETTKDDGSIMLSLNVTKDQLDSAPDFKTLKDLRNAQSAQEPQQQSMAPSSTMTTPPAGKTD